MTELTLRLVAPADAAAYARVARDTFRDAYAALSDPAMMAQHLHMNFGEEQQRAELLDPANTVYTALAPGGEWAGFAALRTGEAPACVVGIAPLQLARLYSQRAWYGRGVGDFLLDAVLAHARRGGHDIVWLQVWELNARARRFYERRGFTQVGTHPYRFADQWEDDLVLVLRT